MLRRAPLLAGAVLALAAAVAALSMLGPWRNGGISPGEQAADAGGPSAQLQWRAGRSQRYRVLVESSFALSMPGASAAQSMDLRLDGDLDYRTLNVETTGITAGMRFTSMDMTIDGARDAAVNRALTTPFRARFAPDGLLLAFEFPAELTAAHREVLENLVRMFQVVILSGPSWQAQEINGSGSYEASYTSISASTVAKQKQRYLSAGTAMAVPEVSSTESIRIDPGHDWITSMVVDETLVIRDSGSVPVRVNNHATLELASGQQQVAAHHWRFPAAAPPESEIETDAVPPLALEDAELRLTDTLAALKTATEGRSPIIQRVRDLLLANDQLPELLLETMRTTELDDRTRADLYLAFELAGSQAAQAALTEVLFDVNWSPQDALRAIVALGGVTQPTDDSLATLWTLAHTDLADTGRRDLPGTAALAIGSLGSTLRTSGNAEYLPVRADLLASAAGADKPQGRAAFLYALGNTADPDPALSRDIVPFLEDPSPRVRSAAARTLGKLATAEVAADLLQTVGKEESGEVRAAIAGSLASLAAPSAESIEWARGAIANEPDESARYNMAVLLGNNLEAFPENRTVLESLLPHEQSRRVRQQLAEALYSTRP